MPEPYAMPELGSRPKLYRLLRDTLYHTSGTILALLPDQVSPEHHELVEVDAADNNAAEKLKAHVASMEDNLREQFSGLLDRLTRLEAIPPVDITALTERVSHLESVAPVDVAPLAERITRLEDHVTTAAPQAGSQPEPDAHE